MYHKKTDTYSCDICGLEMGWEDHDDEHGELWGCELCGVTFCTKCYVERHGRKNYDDMMQSGGYILCPNCEDKLGIEENAMKYRTSRGHEA